MTGYREQFKNAEDRAKAIQRLLTPHGWMESNLGRAFTVNGMLKVPLAKAQDMAKVLFDWLSDYNQMMEGAVRLAIYQTAIEADLGKQAAASLSKNSTVNFNRKGKIGQQAGALYAFFNASMQGTARMMQTLTTNKHGHGKTLRLSPLGKKVIYGGIMLGSMQTLLLLVAGYDDDEPKEFVKERNLILPWFDDEGRHSTIPMPLGFHAIPNIGRIATEFLLKGGKDPAEHVIRLMGIFAEAFNPMGSSGVSMQTIMPTVLDPGTAIMENRDWTGSKIAREDMNSMKPTPGFTRMRDTASAPSKFLAEAMNTLTGGTDYTPGKLSPTPDEIDYLIGQVTGGVGRELGKAQQSISATLAGEEVSPHKIPLIGRFYGSNSSQSSQAGKFYQNLRNLNKVRSELEGRKTDRIDSTEFREKHPEWRLVGYANSVENQISGLRRQKRDMVRKGRDTPEQMKRIDEDITRRMLNLNKRVKEFQQAQVE